MTRGSFYTTEKISKKQSLTPEGFLLCEDVPIARTGMMIYGKDETPLDVGKDGIVKIYRDDSEVFRAETIASANGKPVTNDHPDEDVVPENWNNLSIGVALNVRRGEGAMDDLLIADLLITNPDGIRDIQDGKKEISLGYEADYTEVEKGIGKQTNIVINHIALVDEGRCGYRCAIKDKKTINAILEKPMAKKKVSFYDRFLMRAFKAKDANEVEEIAQEMAKDEDFTTEKEGGDTHIHIHQGESAKPAPEVETQDDEIKEEGRATFNDDDLQAHIEKNDAEHAELFKRIEALEAALGNKTDDAEGEVEADEFEEKNRSDINDADLEEELREEAPDGDEDKAAKAKDSRYLGDSFRDTVSMAEIIAPSIKIPTFDSALKPSVTFKKICAFRRKALDAAYTNQKTRTFIDSLNGGKKFDTSKMTCDAIRTVFRGAATLQANANNTQQPQSYFKGADTTAAPMSISELNALNAKFYNK